LTLRVVVISIQFQYGWISLIGKIRMIFIKNLEKTPGQKLVIMLLIFALFLIKVEGLMPEKKIVWRERAM
jgi:hypothetical protein